MTQTIATLRPAETVAFDHAKLASICDQYGPRAEAYIADVLTEIEGTLRDVRLQARPDRHGELTHTCADLADMAASIGMDTLHRAAYAVLDCLARRDSAALTACLDRLVRLSDADSIGGWVVGQTEHDGFPDTVA